MAEVYAVAVREMDGDFVVAVRDLPEVVTSGDTLEEAVTLAADAIEVAVVGRIVDECDLPTPSRVRAGEIAVPLKVRLAAKAAVYRAFRRSGLRKSDLAGRMGRDEAEVGKILDPRQATRLDQLEAAARALGGRLEINFEAA